MYLIYALHLSATIIISIPTIIYMIANVLLCDKIKVWL